MFEWILLAIGVVGFGLAGYWDLKTTEFPDWLPYSMIISALIVRGLFAFILNDFSIIIDSIFVGLGFLGFGLLLYFLKQWGDGDAWLLGALGFLFPTASGFVGYVNAGFQLYPFPITMLFNFFFIAFFYLIIYSLALGFKTPKISRKFFKELKKDSRSIIAIIVVFSLACLGLIAYLYYFYQIPLIYLSYIMAFPFLLVAVIIFVHYGRFIEKNLFKRKIKVKDLSVGDVPVGDKWRVLTHKEVAALKKKGGEIWIKEGVRFAPVFIITLLITLFYGNLMLLFLL